MEADWKDRLFKAIDADGRSDRAISLAAKLGANFIGQMRGSATKPPKEPSVHHVLKLAGELGLSPVELFAGTKIHHPARTEPQILATLESIDGLTSDDVSFLMKNIKAALADNVGSTQTGPRDQSARGTFLHEVQPARK
ncbi:hypothetical protein [Mesorhizobium sp. A556]